MPDRDYYTKQDADMKEKREKYVAHVTKVLTLLGEPAGQGGGRRKENHGAGDKAGRSERVLA